MDKKELRNYYKQLRAGLSEEEREQKSLQIANQLLKMPIWHRENYHIFLPITRLFEINTEYILHILHGKDKNIILPKMDGDVGLLKHILLTEQTILKQNHLGITEPCNGIEVQPAQIDVVFVPLLAYDQKGNRVGYGGGFYDRFLSNCLVTTLKVGLSFFLPELKIEGVFSTDIPLDYCATPDGFFRF
ncbi:putative 5-formyltetrahydrofolate cyclo-ligase [Capnocytophaga canis]|uniref:5-formyltetrahydrofolate cyclo-ligase n=1 Tax=Capnocytophaga canis TaxID=1848903 RepID=UPI000589A669|nr:5-formyltetrahydrofolate cyclo-ligase [Capnocytophaga canis]CEN46890.1 putative 5-formyltetrahydrofolate cyclo-ligase [Capnocytophaga canis]